MRAKAIKDLSQLNDNDFFVQVSEGLGLIFEHIKSIKEDVEFLSKNEKGCGFYILESVLKEESAKFLILLDAVRCPRVPPDNFKSQLSLYNYHLAKGIYSLVYEFSAPHFKELREAIERECHEYYLDGPNSFDWIFRNEILQKREEHLYVDYVENDEDHYWLSPGRYYHPDMPFLKFYIKPTCYNVATALWYTGCTKPEALAEIANYWRKIEINDDFHWNNLKEANTETIELIDKKKLLDKQQTDKISTIINKWLYPLHSLEIKIIKIDKEKLKESRESQFFSMYY